MKKTTIRILSVIIATALLVSSLVTIEVMASGGPTYYISSSSGNDNYNGTSSSTPWQSITKLNSITFNPGDTICFKCGDTWTGQQFTPHGNGTTSNWITVTSYGTGSNPVISTGNDTLGSIVFSNSNFTGGWKLLNLTIENCQEGILYERANSTHANGLWVQYCTFTNITGANVVTQYQSQNGIGPNPPYSGCLWCSECIFTSGCDNVTVKNCNFSYSDMAFDIRNCNTATVDTITSDHCYREGVWFSMSDNVLMTNSRVTYAGYQKGMWFGTCGVSLMGGTDMTIQNSEIDHTQNPNGSPDGIAVDYEADVVNGTCQNLNIHDNSCSAFLFMENSGWGTQGMQANSKILNCTMTNNALNDPYGNVAVMRYSQNLNNYGTISGCIFNLTNPNQNLTNINGTISNNWPSTWTASNNTINSDGGTVSNTTNSDSGTVSILNSGFATPYTSTFVNFPANCSWAFSSSGNGCAGIQRDGGPFGAPKIGRAHV